MGAAPATRYLLTAAWKDGALTRMEGPREALDDMLKWWSQNGEPVTTFIEPATAQPDARDAEIARLREERDFERGQRDLRHAAYIEERDKAARLTNELEEARAQSRMDEKLATDALAGHVAGKLRADAAEAETKALREALGRLEWQHREMDQAGDPPSCPVCGGSKPHHLAGCWLRAVLAPPEPKAETPAETAGQKEGRPPLAAKHPYFMVRCRGCGYSSTSEEWRVVSYGDDADIACPKCDSLESDEITVLAAPPSLHPAQPSPDVAGTSGESLAGLSKEKAE